MKKSMSELMINDEMMDPLEVLYDNFAEFHGGPTVEILRLSKELRSRLVGMKEKRVTEIFENVAFLCVKYERAGFFGGVRTGVKLMSETQK